jgi:hypothetical protein
MHLSNILQQQFPVSYFDPEFLLEILTTSILNKLIEQINKLIEQKKDNNKDRKKKKYYESILSNLRNVDINDIDIDEHDIDTLETVLNEEIKKSFPDKYKDVNMMISIDNYAEDNITILTIEDTPGLYLCKSVLPFIDNKIEFFPFDELELTKDVYLDYCLNSGYFKEDTIDEITKRFMDISLGQIDEDGLDIFLLCLEELKNINIIMISNKFIGCDNCSKYFFTSSLPNRNIIEDRDCYFIYRYINDQNIAQFHKINFLNINEKEIVNNYRTFSIKRLIRKYKENYELNGIPKVTVEPADNEQDLPIIEIEIETKKIQLLLGSTYNLYTTDYKLVGKMDLIDIDKNSGLCNIYWIDKYPQKLL